MSCVVELFPGHLVVTTWNGTGGKFEYLDTRQGFWDRWMIVAGVLGQLSPMTWVNLG